MLLPALGRARATAKRIGCTNNIRQMALSIIQYGLDNGDIVVPYRAMKDGSRRGFVAPADYTPWTFFIRDWLPFPVQDTKYYPFSSGQGYIGQKRTVAHCPGSGKINESLNTIHYGMPRFFIGGEIATGWATLTKVDPKLFTMITNTAGKALLMDAVNNTKAASNCEDTSSPATDSGITYVYNEGQFMTFNRHQGSINVAFCDGHVSTLSTAQMKAEISEYNNAYKNVMLGRYGVAGVEG